MTHSSIAPSELIINERGAIYHLNCRPEEMAQTIITVGDPDRVKEVSKHFDRIEYQNQHREFITHTGYIGNKRLSVVSTGIGPDNIDIVINELDALANIDFNTRQVKESLTSLNIIRVGTSGSLQADIPVDHFVASTHGLGLDNLLNFYQHHNNEEEAKDETMKAVWYDRQGPAKDVLVYGDMPTPEADPGEVRVKLEASGVNPSDTYRRAGSYAPAYAASKGGIVQFSRSCACAWAPDNIQVNAILPGWIDTALTKGARQQVAGLHERVLARTPAARWGEIDDFAGIAVFLASAASDFVTGTAIPVDGGFSVMA